MLGEQSHIPKDKCTSGEAQGYYQNSNPASTQVYIQVHVVDIIGPIQVEQYDSLTL